jgi:hypothetical protein
LLGGPSRTDNGQNDQHSQDATHGAVLLTDLFLCLHAHTKNFDRFAQRDHPESGIGGFLMGKKCASASTISVSRHGSISVFFSAALSGPAPI